VGKRKVQYESGDHIETTIWARVASANKRKTLEANEGKGKKNKRRFGRLREV
jgi:hypothetical protein